MSTLRGLFCLALNLYLIAVFARVLLSWFPFRGDGAMATITGFLYMITDPLIGPLRRRLPMLRLGGIALDLSPIVVIIAISFVRRALCA